MQISALEADWWHSGWQAVSEVGFGSGGVWEFGLFDRSQPRAPGF